MSDNVYSVNPASGLPIKKPNQDTPEEKERQIIDEHVKTVLAAPPMEPLVVADESRGMTVGEAYRLGARVERSNLSEAIEEYLELGTPDHDLRSLTSFLEWHLGPVS